MIRAQYLTARLVRSGTLASGRRLLVVGGGVAGATTAVLASRYGARVTLIDSAASLFSAQAQCGTRWIDPVQYDWPLPHATAAKWPRELGAKAERPSDPPFGFAAGSARSLARAWASRVAVEQRAPAREFEVELGARGLALSDAGGYLLARYHSARRKLEVSDRFDVVVLARGAKRERTAVSGTQVTGQPATNFFGLEFWQDDKFERRGFGLPENGVDPVLISGAGDGGLQDYIRLTTGRRSAMEVFGQLFEPGPEGDALRLHLERVTHEIEHGAQRALLWNATAQQDHPVLQSVHDAYRQLLDAWRDRAPRHWRYAMSALEKVTMHRSPQRIGLLHVCDHFSNCYPLNRLVVMVIAAFVKAKFPDAHGPLLGRSKLSWARPGVRSGKYEHQCDPKGCWGPRHHVRILVGVTCSTETDLLANHLPVDGLVVRHGIEQHPGTELRRQLLPHRLY